MQIFFVIDGQGQTSDEVLLHDLTELSTRSPKGAALGEKSGTGSDIYRLLTSVPLRYYSIRYQTVGN